MITDNTKEVLKDYFEKVEIYECLVCHENILDIPGELALHLELSHNVIYQKIKEKL